MHPGFCESIIHVGEQPADFCVVTPFKTLAKYAEETAHQLNMRTCIAVSKFDNDVEVALHILNTEKIKLLATRGHALHILRNSTSIPILSIEYSAENFFETLLPFQNSNMRVGHLCFPGQGLKFMRIAQLLGLRRGQEQYRSGPEEGPGGKHISACGGIWPDKQGKGGRLPRHSPAF